jgi:stage III sporulation protein AF
MEGLKALIRNLAFILLLATFLEMLLPNKSMRGFVQMIMGLFVIAAILNPLSDLMNWDLEDKIPAWVEGASTDMPVIAAESSQAGAPEDAGKSAVREQYTKILVSQINSLVTGIDGIAGCETEIELDKNTTGFSDYPKILRINVVYRSKTAASNPVTPVSPVIIGGDAGKSGNASDPDKAAQIKKQVSSFLQISQEIITVQEKS